jgi:S-adenosylmethionine hydrolase
MADTLITLTTDFGTDSPYVAAMKGVILSINPAARLVDLSHDIPPQDVRHTAFFLAEAVPYFPPGTIHVVVVDPGVGSDRAALYVSVAGQRLLVPDNGCWTLLAECHAQPRRVLRLAEARFWRPTVSATFHGRDVFAPVAGYLSLGINPAELGPPMTKWVQPVWPAPVKTAEGITGEVLFVDHFGNLITNIAGAILPAGNRPVQITINGTPVARRVRTYADAQKGELVALVCSSGLMEVAVAQGSAAQRLGVTAGAAVSVAWQH